MSDRERERMMKEAAIKQQRDDVNRMLERQALLLSNRPIQLQQ